MFLKNLIKKPKIEKKKYVNINVFFEKKTIRVVTADKPGSIAIRR